MDRRPGPFGRLVFEANAVLIHRAFEAADGRGRPATSKVNPRQPSVLRGARPAGEGQNRYGPQGCSPASGPCSNQNVAAGAFEDHQWNLQGPACGPHSPSSRTAPQPEPEEIATKPRWLKRQHGERLRPDRAPSGGPSEDGMLAIIESARILPGRFGHPDVLSPGVRPPRSSLRPDRRTLPELGTLDSSGHGRPIKECRPMTRQSAANGQGRRSGGG